MFLLALLFGILLWLEFGINGAWLHIKLGLVGLLLLYYNGFRLAVTSGSKVRNISKWIGIARFQ
jgi:uncharacterized membrane protein